MEETILHVDNEPKTIFTQDKGLAGSLNRMGMECYKNDESGWYFKFTDEVLIIRKPKTRGKGYKEVQLV